MKAISELKINKSQIERLAFNLQNLMNEKNITEAELSRALNLPLMTIRRIVLGETTDPRISTLKLIADHFTVSVDSLIEINEGKTPQLMKASVPKFVPVLDWNIFSKLTSFSELDLSHWKKWQPVPLSSHVSTCAFALESRPSMQPRFPMGSIFVVEPTISPEDGDLVLIKIVRTGELTLRELIIDPPDWQLNPLVPGSNSFSFISSEHETIGIVVLTLLYSRR